MDKKIVRYDAKLIESSNKLLNEQFALVDILLCYAGRNRNRTILRKQDIDRNLPSLYGCPIIAERVIKDDGSEDFGTHGGRIIIDGNGIKYEQTTHALGFITRDAIDSAEWVSMTEKNGHTKHEYLKLSGCVIWHERFEEAKDLLEKDYPQSMEISIKDYEYDDEGYLVIKDFVFTAACVLGSDVEPCFESACIGRHYDLDGCKKDIDAMMKAYDIYHLNKNTKEEEKGKMNKTKMIKKLSEYTYQNRIGETVEKYAVIDVLDNSVGVIDRENLKTYSIDCTEVNDEVVVDMSSKTECIMTYRASTDSDTDSFRYSDEIAREIKLCDDLHAKELEQAESKISKTFAEEFNGKIKEMTTAYAKLKEEYESMSTELEKYKSADKERLEREKHDCIDTLMDKYAKKIGKLPKFLCYRAKLDYTKGIAEIENDLILMAGEAMMGSSKQSFSYTPIDCNVSPTKNDSSKFAQESRYGNLFDKFCNE